MRDLRLLARVASGTVFVVFGAGKFVNHGAEVDSFETYGLPSPDAFVYLIGALEVVGGLLILIGLATRLAALVLGGDMVGAIIVSGLGEGEPISLTLAPALLITMIYLFVRGAGDRSLDSLLRGKGQLSTSGL
jgi:putative oxidoreductase